MIVIKGHHSAVAVRNEGHAASVSVDIDYVALYRISTTAPSVLPRSVDMHVKLTAFHDPSSLLTASGEREAY